MKIKKNNFFGIFSEKYGKMSEKGEKRWKRVIYWLKRSKSIKNENNNSFWAFSEKYGKMSKKGRNDEKGSYIDEKGQNW